MTERRGGARPGAGRKRGVAIKPPEERAIVKNVSLLPEEWKALDRAVQAEGLTRSGLIRRELAQLLAKYKVGL
ncbi:ribbon-helix-helix protein, CopG family [uncultured Desulfovibrio sp.]|uniref:ribbon-helix-helix protein, CopG family n=1 Tax=uncultured Desulfovibrio sp. TaxID=167968 RepID=UPI00272C2C9E|nr:ribbon-helix-helix protein, CopG family [uncultured Desulfovibrio sp.]